MFLDVTVEHKKQNNFYIYTHIQNLKCNGENYNNQFNKVGRIGQTPYI